MRPIGFSTGAVAKGDFQDALRTLRHHGVPVIELSALRLPELAPLVKSLDQIDLSGFQFVSFHAPSQFLAADERCVVELLLSVVDRGIPVVVHPDVISTVEAWEQFGSLLFLENMDKRKRVGRSARDLRALFDLFPRAQLCFDIGHARQFDPTMAEARMILQAFRGRLAEVHISEVNTSSRHDPLSAWSISAFRSVATLIPEQIPVILETLIDQGQSDIPTEIDRARRSLDQAEYTAAGYL
jgi:sugar phosphate isomerase/epimerase